MSLLHRWAVLSAATISSILSLSPTSAQTAVQPAAKGKTVNIPEGTVVKVHLLGGFLPPTRLPYSDVNNYVLQVDEDVVVGGVVVVPRGGLGIVSYDEMQITKPGVKRRPFAAPRMDYGTPKLFRMHMVKVLSIASTELALDPTPILFDYDQINKETRKNKLEIPLVLNSKRQFTAHLSHATLTLP